MTRQHLVLAVRALGYSREEAKRLVEVVLNVIKNRLLTNGKVELPMVGDLLVKDSPTPQRMWRLNRIVTQYAQPKRIVFRPKGDWDVRN
jgi:nucleoid DNA-binding protein